MAMRREAFDRQPRFTAINAVLAEVAPLPTEPAWSEAELLKRQNGPNTCGYYNGELASLLTCFNSELACTHDGPYIGCCRAGFICTSTYWSTCMPYSRRGVCVNADSRTNCCADPERPNCITGVMSGSLSIFGCDGKRSGQVLMLATATDAAPVPIAPSPNPPAASPNPPAPSPNPPAPSPNQPAAAPTPNSPDPPPKSPTPSPDVPSPAANFPSTTPNKTLPAPNAPSPTATESSSNDITSSAANTISSSTNAVVPGGAAIRSSTTTAVSFTSLAPAVEGSQQAPVGAIIGGVVGGLAVVGIFTLLLLFVLRRSRKSAESPPPVMMSNGKINPMSPVPPVSYGTALYPAQLPHPSYPPHPHPGPYEFDGSFKPTVTVTPHELDHMSREGRTAEILPRIS